MSYNDVVVVVGRRSRGEEEGEEVETKKMRSIETRCDQATRSE